MTPLAAISITGPWWPAPLAAMAVAGCCAMLSPLVVAKRWAYVSEGIGHSAYGGAGVVWLLATLLPGVAFFHSYAAVVIAAGLAALAIAVLIGYLQRRTARTGLGFDTATGVVLTATLAFGFAAQVHYQQSFGNQPTAATALLFGANLDITPAASLAATLVAGSVVAGLALQWRAVLAWTLHPDTAQLQGVPTGLVQFGLLLGLALTVALGAQLVGAVLVTAMLVVPGAVATLLGRQLQQVWLISAVASVVAMLGALGLQRAVPTMPLGALVVGLLAVEFIAALLVSRLRRSVA